MIALAIAVAAVLAAAPNNMLEIVIANGPHAGTFKPSDVICIHAKAQKEFSAAAKEFNARDPKALSESGISVSNPDDTGPKRGEVRLAFGNPDKNPLVYDVLIARDSKEPLTMTKNGRTTTLAFEGQTKDGIRLRVTATCAQTDEF